MDSEGAVISLYFDQDYSYFTAFKLQLIYCKNQEENLTDKWRSGTCCLNLKGFLFSYVSFDIGSESAVLWLYFDQN